ncbi:O-antigen ligase family protein [Lysobacter sp. KIS68-7]|uniref:O-antigen ligase family protein n=1 Tax=Lysobacter sp. KIS68-7 TaxID=2904252 RepID=UPI001E4008B3|nr:O-antigen ligase family protein [Lysobacter sp. KIS68-7]UHQ18460.1 O-antigen ligase family protein [Lysobacter sp. KIS68-7]
MSSVALPSLRRDTAAFVCAAVLIVAALLFGGGPRGMGDAVVHLAMLPCLALAVMRWNRAEATRWERAFAAWCMCALALIALQLLPLPPALWSMLPQRAGVLADLTQAGVSPGWQPMTLDAWATVRAGVAFVTFAATWWLCTTLGTQVQRRLLLVALVVGVALAFFGFAQAAAWPQAVRFYAFHHPIGAIGSFANRNHFADLLAMLLPISLAFAAQAQREMRATVAAWAFAATAVLWLAAALTFSRTGFLLASCALALSAAILWWPRAGMSRRWIAPVFAMVIAVLAVGHYAWDGLMQRLAQDPLDDLRWQYLRHSLEAMQAYLPFGSGLGSFPFVYAPLEPLAEMGSTFAERAHNDPLQIAIEAGLPGLALALAFVVLVAWKTVGNVRAWRAEPLRADPIRSVMGIALAVPLVHAWVDYSLRTLAVSVLAGLLLSYRGGGRQAKA